MDSKLSVKNYKKGIIFSCNDKVYDWVVVFLESVREFNPDLPLVLIPYDNNVDRVLKLADKFKFEVFDDGSLEDLDCIGKRLHLNATAHAHHSFRRLSAFWGPLEEFIYIDVDIAVLHNLEELFSLYETSNADILYYDRELNQVYLEGNYRSSTLTKGRNTGFNSGFWLSRQGLISKATILSIAEKAERFLEDFNIRNADQPFLNFMVDELELSAFSFPELRSDLSLSIWARNKRPVSFSGGYMNWDHGGLNHRKLIVALHWAGINISPAMPCVNFYLRYRHKSCTSMERTLRDLKWHLLRPFQLIAEYSRKNYFLNRLYKKIYAGEDVQSLLMGLSGSQHSC